MEQTEAKQKTKKIVDIAITVAEIIVVLIAIAISAIVIANPIVHTATVAKGKIKLLPVLSDSMKGGNKDSFAKGALVIAREPKDKLALKKGDIVTFAYAVNGRDALVTHRIVEVRKGAAGKAETYVTRGDNNPDGMTEIVNPRNVLAVYKTHVSRVGDAVLWLQDSTHFALVVILPLGLLFAYNIVAFVMMLLQARGAQVREQAERDAEDRLAALKLDEDEIARAAIEEYKKRVESSGAAAAGADAPKETRAEPEAKPEETAEGPEAKPEETAEGLEAKPDETSEGPEAKPERSAEGSEARPERSEAKSEETSEGPERQV